MPQQTNLNISPYYDDFDSEKDFHRVLFRPGYSIQTRELTTLQTILQNQIESHGRYNFKQGELVIPGEVGLNTKLDYVKLSSVSEVAVNVDGEIEYQVYDIKQLVGSRLSGVSSGVVASVIDASLATETESDTIFVKYETSGDSTTEFTFRQGEVLEVIDGVNTPLLTVGTDGASLPIRIDVRNPDTGEVTSEPSTAMGFASAVKVEQGIYFINGFFVRNREQLLVVDKYSNTPSTKVGFLIEENIVKESDDSSLYDNSRGSSNFASPGAHRLNIDLILTQYGLDESTDKNFTQLLSIKNGVVQKKVEKTDYSVLEQTLARRTYDESGDYVVDNFDLDLREYYQQNGNTGFYKKDDEGLVNGISEFDASGKLIASVGPGKAYVKGFEIVNKETQYFEVDKARDTIDRNNVVIKTNGLSEYKISNMFGTVPLNEEGSDLSATPTLYLGSTFNDGSVGLNGVDTDTSTYNKFTLLRRGENFSYEDSQNLGSVSDTEIAFKTIIVKRTNLSNVISDTNYPQELWVVTNPGAGTDPAVTYATVVSFSNIQIPKFSEIGEEFVEFTLFARKDILDEYFGSYSEDSGFRYVYTTRSAALTNLVSNSLGEILDYSESIISTVGIAKPKNISLVERGSGFNSDIDKVISSGRGISGNKEYNTTFGLNYFNPIFFTRLLIDTKISIGFTPGKYITGSISNAVAVIEGEANGSINEGNQLLVKMVSGEFVSGETIFDEDQNSLRVARENTISHFVITKKGSGFIDTDRLQINGVNIEPSVAKPKLAGGLLVDIDIENRNGLTQEYTNPPFATVVPLDPEGRILSEIIIEPVLFKNVVYTYTNQNVKSLSAAFGLGNSNIFTSDIDLNNQRFVESKPVTSFSFTGTKGTKYIECNGFSADASTLLVQGDFIQFTDIEGNVIRGIVQYATTPVGTEKSRIYLNNYLQNDVLNSPVTRVRPIVSNADTASLVFPTGSRQVSSIAKDLTDTKISYFIRRDFVVTASSTGGSITFAANLALGSQRFVSYDERYFLLTVLDKGSSTTVENGDVVYIRPDFVSISNPENNFNTGSVVITFPENYFGEISSNFPKLKLTATLEVTKATPRLKTANRNKRIIVVSNRDNVIPIRGRDFDDGGLETRSYSDVFKLRYVYEGTPTSPPEVDANGILVTGTDVTNRFVFDDGQRETFYDVSRIILKSGVEQPTGQLVIGFDYFDHSQGDFCTVDSYVHESGVLEEEVPLFNSSVNGVVSLRDVIDFRPKVDTTTTVSGFQDTSIISTEDFISFISSGGSFSSTPASDLNIEYTLKFNESVYLDRIDAVFLKKTGEFIVSKGNPSLNPSNPPVIDEAIPLYYLNIPAFTNSSKDVRIIPVDNRRYTMRDIGKLEKRIERLEYYTTLSILEQQALNMQVKDDLGLDKFKSGFIVDNFETHRVGPLKSSDYVCSIDTQRSLLRPTVSEDSFNLVESNVTETDREILNYTVSNGVVTLPYTDIFALGNNFATSTVNPNPFVVLQYAGDLTLSPNVDQWYDTSIAPIITDNNTNLFSVLLAKSDVKEAYSSLYDSFVVNWVGAQKTFFNINSFVETNTQFAESLVESASVASTSNISPENNELAKGVSAKSINGFSVNSSIQFFARSIPVKFVLSRMKPLTKFYAFIEGRNVSRWVNIDSKFTGIAGNSLTTFNSDIITDENGSASGIILIPAGLPPREGAVWTGDIKTVSYDEAAEELRITTGNKTIRFTSSQTNEELESVDSFADAKFYSTGILPQNPGSITSTQPSKFKANEGLQLVDSNTDIKIKPNPLAQIFRVEDFEGGLFMTGVDLFFSTKSSQIPIRTYITNVDTNKPGKYIVPGSEKVLYPNTFIRVIANGNLSIDIGESITGLNSQASGPLFKVLDRSNNEIAPLIGGSVTLSNEQVYTLVLNNHNGKEFLPGEKLSVQSLTEFNNSSATGLNLTIAKNSGKLKRLNIESTGSNYENATLIIESPQLPGSANASGVVSVSGGKIYDSEIVLSGSGYTAPPSIVIRGVGDGAAGAVITSEIEIDTPAVRMGVAIDDGVSVNSTTPTRFKFDFPVYLQNDTEYALTIETDSIDYSLWTSELGQSDVTSNITVSSLPSLGSLYKNQNTGGWTENLFEDIKFNMYRAEFDISRSGQVTIVNENLGLEKLSMDSIETYALSDSNATSTLFKNNNRIVKVNHRNNGFEDNSSFVFYKQIENVGGFSGITFNTNEFKVINSGIDYYNIEMPFRASSSQVGGGSDILASYNRKYEKLYPQISYLQIPGTTIDATVRTTNVVPTDSNTQNYTSYSQTEFEQTFINQQQYFENQKIICSDINEIENGIDNSLSYKLSLNSTVSYLSPVIDLGLSSVKLSSLRLENSTGYEDRFGKRYQILKYFPVYELTLDAFPAELNLRDVVNGLTSGATGTVVKISSPNVYIKTTSVNAFSFNEIVKFPDTIAGNEQTAQVNSVSEYLLDFSIGDKITAANKSNANLTYDNLIDGFVVNWDPKNKEIYIENNKFPINGNYTANSLEVGDYARESIVADQTPDIFRVGDLLRFADLPAGNELYVEISDIQYTTGIEYADETNASDTSGISKYLIKEVSLQSPATGIDVRTTLNVQNIENVRLYYRIKESSSQSNFSNINWVAFNGTGLPDNPEILATQSNNISSQYDSQKNYQELKYSVSNLPEFNSFSVKIVMQGEDPVYAPKIQDIRIVSSF